MTADEQSRQRALRRAARDIGVTLLLIVVTSQLFAQAERRRPEFSTAEIQVIAGTIASFTTVQVSETAAAPQNRSSTLRSRSAFRLAGYPPNLLFYIPGSGWDMAADLPVGAKVRLEVTEDSDALAVRARNFPDADFLLPIRGLQIGDEVRFRASDEIARAEAAAARYQRLGWAAVVLLPLWLGWLAWPRRRGLQALIAAVGDMRDVL